MLPAQRLESVGGWGMAVSGAGYVYRPSSVDQLRDTLASARAESVTVVPRGAGCSYGDAAMANESVVLDMTRCRRILDWNPETGIVEVEPGTSLRDLWRYALGDGWWPAIVTGTMDPTVGGCLGMNVHGKNNWQRGTFGEHCLDFDLMTADGEVRTVDREADHDLFHSVVSAFGQFGVITRARLQLKPVESGLVHVRAVSAPDLGEILRLTDENKDRWEYVVGWIDAFRRGRKLGGGLLHYARHLGADEDPTPAQSLRVESQDLPDTIMGLVPKSIMWRFLSPFSNRPGMRLVNLAKYITGSTVGEGGEYRQSLAGFSFLLDYVPHWKNVYLPDGLIQHQSFVPIGAAESVFARVFELCRKRGMPSFLAVLKRHRPDGFLFSHGVDGFSLALDFPVHARRRPELWQLVRELAELVVEAGGRFYPAKDSALTADLYRRSLGDETLDRYAMLKDELDPNRLFRSDLGDRLLS